MRARMLMLGAGLALLLTLPSVAQQRGPLRYGAELRAAESGETALLVCRPLYLRGDAVAGEAPHRTVRGEVFLDYIAGDYLPLLTGFIAYRTCRVDQTTNPPRVEGLGQWAIVDVAQRHVCYPRFLYFDEARSTPAWQRNLVAYWGMFGEPGTLEAVVVDWQHKLIVARHATELKAPPDGDPLPAPRWDYSYRRRAPELGWRLAAHFEFAGQTLRLLVSSAFLR